VYSSIVSAQGKTMDLSQLLGCNFTYLNTRYYGFIKVSLSEFRTLINLTRLCSKKLVFINTRCRFGVFHWMGFTKQKTGSELPVSMS
jgi:hypothetical protein